MSNYSAGCYNFRVPSIGPSRYFGQISMKISFAYVNLTAPKCRSRDNYSQLDSKSKRKFRTTRAPIASSIYECRKKIKIKEETGTVIKFTASRKEIEREKSTVKEGRQGFVVEAQTTVEIEVGHEKGSRAFM